ncbi:hypothetical protein ACF06O_20300 [Streptomyces albidoflavus]
MQIDPADSGHQDAPPGQPEPGREPDRLRPLPDARVRAAARVAPGLLVSVAGTDAPGQTLVMVEE